MRVRDTPVHRISFASPCHTYTLTIVALALRNKWQGRHLHNLVGWKREGDLSGFELFIYWDLQAHSLSGSRKRENIQWAAAVRRKVAC